jgi:histidine decarboxylase
LQLQPYRAAFRLLSNAGYRVISHEHLLVRLEKRPGALAALSRRLADAQVDVRGMHIVNKDQAAVIVALEATQPDRARSVLADLLVLENPRPER